MAIAYPWRNSWKGSTVDKHNTSPASSSVPARRRLVRGVFAAPAALTLYAGSAHATPSLTCVARQISSPQLPVPATGTDVWVRIQAYNLGDSQWVKTTEVKGLAGARQDLATSYAPGGEYYCVQGGSGFVAGTAQAAEPTLTNFTFAKTSSSKYYALRFDAAGNITGLITDNSGTGTALSGSCWASFRG